MSGAVLAAALIGCAWPCAGERKNNLSLNRNDDDKYLRYKDEMTSVVLESFPHCLVRVNQVGGVGRSSGRVLLMAICGQEPTTCRSSDAAASCCTGEIVCMDGQSSYVYIKRKVGTLMSACVNSTTLPCLALPSGLLRWSYALAVVRTRRQSFSLS